MNFFRPSRLPEIAPIGLPDGGSIAVSLRRSTRAQRMALRLHPAKRLVELVLPSGASIAKALDFLKTREGWIVAQALRLPVPVPFVDGAEIPVLGIPHRLHAAAPHSGAAPFRIADGRIDVTGRREFIARRTKAGLVAHAREILSAKTVAIAARIGQKPGRLSVGDAATRWGSCAASRNIKYSWRLVLAPEPVLDYVVAHEVAHLVEMNHSNRFWRLVETLHPGFEAERDWLKRHGPRLLTYGLGSEPAG
jgi:predicted metal-dependent hydrolase